MGASIRFRRLAFRTAYALLRGWWWLTRPSMHGAKCAITDRDRVLLVRHTYGPRVWDFPGGKVERHEPPRDTAAREMSEELGIDGVDWRPLGVIAEIVDFRHDTVHCFRGEVHAPLLRVNAAELERAEWFPRAAPPRDLAPHAAEILAMLDGAAG